jgi:hypothetical protein
MDTDAGADILEETRRMGSALAGLPKNEPPKIVPATVAATTKLATVWEAPISVIPK